MKKLLGVCFVFIATVLLVACGRELDHRSILDVDTDTILRLGDSLSRFENTLGAGEHIETDWLIDIEDAARYSFSNGILEVIFSNGNAVSISQNEQSTRFQFSDMSFDMSAEDMAGRFAIRDLDLDFVNWYDRFYDSRGRDVASRADATYIATITYWRSDTIGYGISRLTISVVD